MKTTIFDYGMNGEGVGKINNKIVLVPFALKNEEIDFNLSQDFSNYSIGKMDEIITKSKERVCPNCPYFYNCGGCQLQHISYAEQLKFKQELVQKTIKKIARIDVKVEDTIASKLQYNYRNKMSFNVIDDKIGFFVEGSKNLVEIASCPLTTNNINEILKLFAEYLKTNEKLQQVAKNLVIREINEQILVGVVVREKIDILDFYHTLSANLKNVGLYEVINNRKDSVVLSGKTILIGGIDKINIENFDLKYSVDLLGFHQTNIDIQDKIYNTILDLIDNNSIVCNGFSGQGLLTAVLSKKAKKVYGIELNKSSHTSAEELKKTNNVNIVNICGDFNKEINKIKNLDTLVLDPSKKGLGKEIIDKINTKNVVYISCNPIALAKDLSYLTKKYTIEKIIPFDMFPNTKNVETVVKLKKSLD